MKNRKPWPRSLAEDGPFMDEHSAGAAQMRHEAVENSHRCSETNVQEISEKRPVEAVNFAQSMTQRLSSVAWASRMADVFLYENMVYFGDLAISTENTLRSHNKIGTKTIENVKKILADYGLALGMKIPEWCELREQLA
jgi:DNA-directed RNA polymerase alpha subunit